MPPAALRLGLVPMGASQRRQTPEEAGAGHTLRTGVMAVRIGQAPQTVVGKEIGMKTPVGLKLLSRISAVAETSDVP